MKVVLIDDHEMFREALTQCLAGCAIEVVGQASNAREGLAQVTTGRPDVIVMDLALSGADGISATRDFRRTTSRPPILMLSATAEPAFAAEALRAGASGYAVKTQSFDELVRAIEQTAFGRRYVAPVLAEALGPTFAGGEQTDILSPLSVREREVFDLIVAGRTSKEVGQELFISVKTVGTHRARINKKLRARSTADLVRLAARSGRLVL